MVQCSTTRSITTALNLVQVNREKDSIVTKKQSQFSRNYFQQKKKLSKIFVGGEKKKKKDENVKKSLRTGYAEMGCFFHGCPWYYLKPSTLISFRPCRKQQINNIQYI